MLPVWSPEHRSIAKQVAGLAGTSVTVAFHSYPEMVTGFFFILMTVLWFTREPGFVPGWDSFFEK